MLGKGFRRAERLDYEGGGADAPLARRFSGRTRTRRETRTRRRSCRSLKKRSMRAAPPIAPAISEC
jgi:hypothetical protein